ncbi:homoserine dehydrogenase [Alkaliphilus transvaalensis]|nr:homoserine dehydrogenase [Alkaliphilus sp. AH-315-G20]MBN4067623.1 homoserine dehydrogenase [Alkaliphilus transvaalensis]
MMRKYRIGILGMGTVGQGFINNYHLNKEEIDYKIGGELDFVNVLVRNTVKKRDVNLDKKVYTNQFDNINLKELDVVVELIGGVSSAFEYIKKALENGCHVVTANKELMAKKGIELIKTARENEVLIRYEASVGGGIPIISTLNDSLSSNKIERLMGILNGTTNYILTKMTKEKMSFKDVLKEAQELGFAEADPTSDVNGSDAAYKLAILSKDAFGIIVNPEDISREGIRNISLEDIEYGQELGYKIKLLALGEKSNEHVELSVQPALIPVEHPIASVNYEFNALFIEGNVVGEIMLYGKGAGSMPTGSAVLTDVIDITRKKNDYIGTCSAKDIVVNNIGRSAYYVRMEVVDLPGVLGKIAVSFGEQGVSLDSVVQRARGGKHAPLVFITHEIDRATLNAVLESIQKNNYVLEVMSIIRVVN